MKRLSLIFETLVAIFAGAPMIFAAPFNPRDVAADPALLLHVDVDAVRGSSVGQSLLSDPEVQDKLAAVGAMFDFDLRRQLHGVTIYTTEEHPKDGALIVYADFDPNRLIKVAKGAEGFESVTNGSHVIYSWVDEKKKAKVGGMPRVCGAIMGHRVVFAQNEAHLADALKVIDGSAPDFSGKPGLTPPAAGESILAQGAMLKFALDSDDQNSALFKMSKSVRLKLSEAAGSITTTVRFEAADADTATQISFIAQGLLAMFKLQKPDPDLLKLANALDIKQDGAMVGLTISEPSSVLVSMIKDAQKKAEANAQDTNPPPEKQ